jgi:hypothetical protein
MRDVKTLAKTEQRDARMAVAASSVILVVVVLIASIAGAAAPV